MTNDNNAALVERRVGALEKLKRDIPSYAGDAPKAKHYQWLHDALDAAITALKPDGDDVESQGVSACNKCGEQYPSAPAGTVHKCGKCSGGYCSPITTHPDTEAERLLRRLLPYVNAAHAGIDTSEEREALRREIDTHLTTKGGGK